jgi:YbbR domain-containing protein
VDITKKKILFKIFSLALAIILWSYVVNQASLEENTVNSTALSYNNLADSLYIEEGPESVQVRVWGSMSHTAEIIAYLDLEGLGVGIHTVPVRLVPIRDALLTRVQPDEVLIRIGQQDQQIIPITYEVTNPPPAGYGFISAMILPGESVVQVAEGSEAVSAVVAPLNLTGVRQMVEQTVNLELRDRQGQKVEGIRVEPKQVKVYIVVEENVEARLLEVQVQYTGDPAENYYVSDIKVEPARVTLLGSASVLAAVNQLATLSVDIAGVESDFTSLVSLNLPNGLMAYPSQVLVTFSVAESQTQIQEREADDEITRP